MSETGSTAPPASTQDTSSKKAVAAPAPPEQRYIPGAPPPATKSGFKKKRSRAAGKSGKDDKGVELQDTLDAALTDAAPTDTDIKEGRVADELVANETDSSVGVKKPSPLVEAINKRTKVLTKKLARVSEYQNKPPNTLNDDQRRVVASLPVLEGIIKEHDDIKKLIETQEKEDSVAAAQKQEEQESVHAAALKEAVAEAESNTLSKIQFVLAFLQLSSTITSQSVPYHLSVDEIERIAIIQATQTLINADPESKEEIIKGLSDEDAVGEVEGVPFSRFRELTNAFIHPPSAEPTPAVGSLSALNDDAAGIAPTASEAEILLSAADQPASGAAGTFAYIQNAELDAPEIPSSGLMFGAVNPDDEYESGTITNTQQEWVNVEAPQSSSVNGADASEHPAVEEVAPVESQPANIDWAADDEHDLPPLEQLHAKFGPSGEATPTSAGPTTPAPEASIPEAVAEAIGESSGDQSRPPHPNGSGHPNRGHRRGSGFRGGDRGDRGGRGRGGSGFRGRGRGDGQWRHASGSVPSTPVTPGTPDEDGWISTAPKPKGGSGFRGRGRGGSGFRGRGGSNQNQNQQQQQPAPPAAS